MSRHRSRPQSTAVASARPGSFVVDLLLVLGWAFAVWTLLTPFGISVGLAVLIACAAYLAYRAPLALGRGTESQVHDARLHVLRRVALLPIVLAAVVNVWMLIRTPPWAFFTMLALPWLVVLLTVASVAASLHESTDDSPEPAESQNRFPSRAGFWCVVAFVLLQSGVYFALNYALYRGVLIPHGDSGMYEEHLWNVTHGKGFRSYLDQGLFLGEHIQVIHLFLLPVHLVWPSLLPMEFAESLALYSGAIPLFWMTRRAGASSLAAVAVSAAYLCYVPLHFLDIAIDLKTFRPIAFGVPAVLFGLDQLERRRYITAAVCLVLALLAKEDFPLVFVPLGAWLAGVSFRERSTPEGRTKFRYGIGLALLTGAYLLLATRVLIPWFRDGAEVHYAGYFQAFGESLTEVAITMLTRPDLVLSKLLTPQVIYAWGLLLLPLGLLPILAPTRFAVALPMLVLLGLNEIAPEPVHHFHAPVVPILWWATIGGLSRADRGLRALLRRLSGEASLFVQQRSRFGVGAGWLLAFALATQFGLSYGLGFGHGPLSWSFWERESPSYWRSRYVGDPGRERDAEAVITFIPRSARVAATDYIHTRLTHYERSYDYSNYKRRVAGNTTNVPDDTEFIVIDRTHRYSTVAKPEDIRELREAPDEWELTNVGGENFFVLKRRARNGNSE